MMLSTMLQFPNDTELYARLEPKALDLLKTFVDQGLTVGEVDWILNRADQELPFVKFSLPERPNP